MKSRTREMGVSDIDRLETAIALEAVDKLRDTYLPWLERAVEEAVAADVVWRRPREGVNSIGNLLLHLAGNVRQWMLHGLDGQPDTRERDAEFEAEGGMSPKELMQILRSTVLEACEVIEQPRSPEAWLRPCNIQGFDTNALAAVIHVVEHFSYHTGQVVMLVKAATGKDLKFYDL